MKRLTYMAFFLPLLLWWIPILGPFLTGLLISYNFKTNYKYSLIIAIISSILLSLLTSYVLIDFIKIDLFTNFFHLLVIILNIIGSIICITTSYVSSRHGTFSRIIGNSMEIEFTANDINEIDNILSNYFNIDMCSKPNMKIIDENQVEVSRICDNNIRINYKILRSGKVLRVKAKFFNDISY